VHRNEHLLLVVNAPLLTDRPVLCVVIQEMLEGCCYVMVVAADTTGIVLQKTIAGWHLAVPGLPPRWHTTRPPWREGPWRLRYSWCTMKLSLFLPCTAFSCIHVAYGPACKSMGRWRCLFTPIAPTEAAAHACCICSGARLAASMLAPWRSKMSGGRTGEAALHGIPLLPW
jgi:hypothetical protein